MERVLKLYSFNLNKLKIFKNLAGFVNTTFLIVSGKNKFILRRARKETSLAHLKLEVAILNYLKIKKFSYTSYVIKTKRAQFLPKYRGHYYSLQNYVAGETKASWDDLAKVNLAMLKDLFRVSAEFTKAARHFKYTISKNNLTLYDKVIKARNDFIKLLKDFPPSTGKVWVMANAKEINQFIENNIKEFKKVDWTHFPKQLVHLDLHPGNVHYKGNRVVGLFDFDWIQFDCRITDIGATICQACYFYGGPKAGIYRKDRIQAGLKIYRQTFGRSEFSLKEENELIKIALKGNVIFQLVFIIQEYLSNLNSKRHLVAVDQFIKIVKRNNFDELFI